MRPCRSSLLPALAATTLLIGASLLEPLARGGDSVPMPTSELAGRTASEEQLAQAVRACDLTEAETKLQALTGEQRPSARGRIEPELVLGLGAASCGLFSASLEFLRSTQSGSEFEDWRLYGIARSSIELGQYAAAKAALDSLRERYPDSPLFAKAIVAAAELARQRGDLNGISELDRQSGNWPLDAESAETLEVAAWHAASELGNASMRREVAARLLVEYPLSASTLKVVEEFRALDGSVDWMEFLNPDQMVLRAESLLRVGLHDSATETLAQVPADNRDLNWHLVAADALTASRRGQEALETLEDLPVGSPSAESDIEWRRAFAALEVSKPRRGRQLSSLQRRMMRDRAHKHLQRVVQLGLEPDRSKQALRVLFENALEEGLFDHALAILRRLKAIDPDDTSGARHLWQYGWKQHRDRNYSGAIGYWKELSALYPTSTYNRSGLYWSARAHETLGNLRTSRQLLEEVANVPFTDFYRRHALRRLGQKGEDEGPAAPTEPWPRDPILDRAEKLAGSGLDRAALLELDALTERADSRAAGALKSVILSAAGERRKSIMEIKGTFPLLGTPFQGLAPDRARLLYYPLAFDQIIAQHAQRNELDRNLVLAMVRQESAFDPGARSWAGARGLMQVMPATGREIARRLGLSYSRERLNDPSFSIQIGTTYYRQVRSMFDENEELALAGYNAGPYRIKRLWRQAGKNAELDRFLESLRLEETKSYVKRVLLFADSYRRLYPVTGPGGDSEARSTAG